MAVLRLVALFSGPAAVPETLRLVFATAVTPVLLVEGPARMPAFLPAAALSPLRAAAP